MECFNCQRYVSYIPNPVVVNNAVRKKNTLLFLTNKYRFNIDFKVFMCEGKKVFYHKLLVIIVCQVCTVMMVFHLNYLF